MKLFYFILFKPTCFFFYAWCLHGVKHQFKVSKNCLCIWHAWNNMSLDLHDKGSPFRQHVNILQKKCIAVRQWNFKAGLCMCRRCSIHDETEIIWPVFFSQHFTWKISLYTTGHQVYLIKWEHKEWRNNFINPFCCVEKQQGSFRAWEKKLFHYQCSEHLQGS